MKTRTLNRAPVAVRKKTCASTNPTKLTGALTIKVELSALRLNQETGKDVERPTTLSPGLMYWARLM